jgi:hypothetical protein
LKIVGGFAATGFCLPLLLLAFWEFSQAPDVSLLLFWVCPTSIMSMGLDGATGATAIEGWLVIGASNAVLYAVVGLLVALILNLIRRFRVYRRRVST